MAQRARRNIPRDQPRTISQSIESIHDGIKKEDLDSLESHFNWHICNDISISTLKERIHTVESNIEVNIANIQPQSYCLLSYLKSKLGENVEVMKNLDCAIKALSNVASPSTLGYEAVIRANLVIVESQLPNQGNAKEHYERYNKIKKSYESKTRCHIAEHPEVLAMKAFAYGSFGGKKSKESVEAYVAALSNEKHKDRVEWLFGLALAMNLVTLNKESKKEDELSTMESIYRRVIQLDDAYPLAMCKLARTLVKLHEINGFQEVEYWNNKALEKDRSVNSLQEAASVYQMMASYNEKYYDKALKLFREAKEIAHSSKDTVLGLGRCFFNMYLNENKALKKKYYGGKPGESRKNLMEAMTCYEKVEHLRHSEKLLLANIYSMLSKYQQTESEELIYIAKAEKKYKEVIKETEKEKENEKKSFRFVEACFRYSNFLKSRGRFDEEMEFLNIVISTPLEDDFGDIRYIHQSEEKLLSYTQNKYMMKDRCKAYELQSVIQFNRGNIHSAIFNIREAIKIESSNKENYKEKLGDYLLKASKAENPIYLRGTNQEYFNEAYNLIASLNYSEKKIDLEFEMIEIRINSLIPNNDHALKLLKKYIMNFEKSFSETKIKLRSDAITFSQLDEDQLINILDIITESKRILDRSMNLVKKEIYTSNTNNVYYPAPWVLDKLEFKSMKEKMENYLQNKKKCNFTNFSTKLPNLFEFLVKKQEDPTTKEIEWLRIFPGLRNDREHINTGLTFLKEKFSEKGFEIIKCYAFVSLYAIEVSKKFKIEVDTYVKRMKVETSEDDVF